jgi:hypothetical protein
VILTDVVEPVGEAIFVTLVALIGSVESEEVDTNNLGRVRIGVSRDVLIK